MPAAILGDRACGKTTFLGLLFAAQTRYTNDPANEEIFKFHADPATVNTMGDTYNQLRGGGWPDATVKGQLTKYSFLFGYKKAALGVLPNWLEKKVVKSRLVNPYLTMKFTVFDVAGEDVQDIIRTPDGVMSPDLPEDVKSLLESRVLVILIDASRITAKPRTKPFIDMITYDKNMATLISLVAEYNSKKEIAEERKIYPVFMLTKFDAIADKSIFEDMKLKEQYPTMDQQEERKAYAETIMRNFFKVTLALIKGGTLKGVSFDDGAYFFSEINTEFNQDGLPVPVLEKHEGGYEIDFSYDEYVGFINHFKKIVKEMPTDIKDEQEFAKN